jgi:hypothetical protein
VVAKLTAEAIAAGGLLALAAGYVIDTPKARSKASPRRLLASTLLITGGVAVTGGLGVLIDCAAAHHPQGVT